MFNVISERTFAELQLGAGVLLNTFDPTNVTEPDDDDIICATSGGLTVAVVPTFKDLGEDIDNCPKNTADLKSIESWEVTISTTALAASPEFIQLALGAADIDSSKITPRALQLGDFKDLWWVGEMGACGYVAVKLINALSTGGFSLTTEDKGKGKISITLTGHATLDDPDTVPVEFYADDGASLTLDKSTATVAVNGTTTIVATTAPVGQPVTWESSTPAKATVENGVVTGKAAGSSTITASMTYGGKTYSKTCTVTVS